MIQVLYSCADCGISEKAVSVRSREKTEDAEAWVDSLAAAIATDHRQVSPHCRATKIAKIKIPRDSNPGISGNTLISEFPLRNTDN